MIEQRSIEAERTLLVGLYDPRTDPDEPDLSLDELASLVEAAGGSAVGRVFQRGTPTPATFIGRGKAAHVADLVGDLQVKLVVFDNELSPAQIRELEKVVGCKVIDRSELILDIFASRARTKEAKLQVELAQLQYTSPRLRGMWTHLERQQASSSGAGLGPGMRGPGEKQIEIDRRIVSRRITRLKSELAQIHGHRERQVRGRNARVFTVGLVGYTNAGKSTLLNALTAAGTYEADQLFATLDTKTRRWPVEPGVDVALSDTVGFVRHLPHHLVASFRSTLEEALSADLLLHVIDASHPQVFDQIAAVERVLTDLGCDTSRVVPVLNKIDKLATPEQRDTLTVLRARVADAVAISARTGEGTDGLEQVVAARRRAAWVTVAVEAPAGNGKVRAYAHEHGHILQERFDDDIWIADVELSRAALPGLQRTNPTTIREH